MNGKRKNIEDVIQKQLVLWLKQHSSNIEFFFNKNEGKKSIVEAVNDKKMGLTAGRPDLDLYINDFELDLTYILHLELKKKDGKLNAAQKIWHNNFKPTLNRQAKVAYGFDEAKEIINQWIAEI